MRLTDLRAGLVSKPASAEDAAARVAREAAEGRKAARSRAARAYLTLDPSLAEEVEPDDPEVDALVAQVAVETAAHQHCFFPHYVTRVIFHTLSLSETPSPAGSHT